MIKYINGKVEIWFSDLPPTNINSIWMYKNVTVGDPDDYVYDFRVYNRHKDLWETVVDAETYEMVDQYPTINDFPDVGDPIPPSETKLYIDQEFKNAYFYSNGNYYKIVQDSPDYMNTDGSNSNVKTFVFNTAVDEVTGLSAGMMRWSQDDGTLNLGMNGGDVEQSIGLELYYRVTANAQITNGRLVAAAGTPGNSGTILASHAGPGIDPRYILGIATQNINTGERGFVTWFGKIRHIKTNGNGRGEVWANGDLLYQSPTYVGELTKTQPPAPYNKAPIAIIISAHATNGAIFVRIQRSLKLDNINDVDVATAVPGNPLAKGFDNVWRAYSSIILSQITGENGEVDVIGDLRASNLYTVGEVQAEEITAVAAVNAGPEGFKKLGKTDDDLLLAGGGDLAIQDLKAGIYQLYNPSNNTQVVLEINAAGQVLVTGDIIQNGDSYIVDAEEITTKEQQITLRSDATTGMPINDLAGFIIKLYDGVNDGMIVIDNTGTLRIGDVGDLQPVLTREETPVNQSPLFFNTTTKRAETLPGTTTKSLLVDNDAVMVKDSADTYKPKWWSFANIKANLKSYFDTLYLRLADVSQTVAGTITFSKSPVVPNPTTSGQALNKGTGDSSYVGLTGNQTIANVKTFTSPPVVPSPVNNNDAANKAYVQSVITVGNDTYQENKLITDARVATLENVINSANINQETTATATGVDTIALPKTAANGGMQVQLFGQSAQNLVTNGDFRNGTTGWNIVNATATTLQPTITITNTAGSDSQINQNTGISALTGLKFYSSAKFKVIGDLCANIGIIIQGQTSGLDAIVQQLNPVNGTEYKLSGLFALTSAYSGNIFLRYRFVFSNSTNAIGKKLEISNVIAINLTATFGAGNEPTKEQCDVLFANYFEGSDNVLGTGRVRSVGKNLLNLNTLGKKIYTGTLDGMTAAQRLLYYDILMPIARTGVISSSLSEYVIEPNRVEVTTSLSSYGIGFKIKAKAGDIFTSKTTTSTGYIGFGSFNSSGVNLSNGIGTFTCPEGTAFILVALVTNTANVKAVFIDSLIERGTTATTYEPFRQSILQLTTPPLRSNGLIKDEIRKGANGYELVKRVGVGTLGTNIVINGTFDTDTGWAKASDVTISGGTFNINSAEGMTSNSTSQVGYLTAGKWYKVIFTVVSISRGLVTVRPGHLANVTARSASGTYSEYILQSGNNYIYITGMAGAVCSIDNISFQEVSASEAIAATSKFTELGSNIHYTLATPTITPIPHAGLLNSNSNGTAYFEPIIADAGVYASNIAVQLTDYPIASFESIRKYANGTYTELSLTTGLTIAPDGLSFTHSGLNTGDLVMFTYAYSKDSIGRSMTLSYAISNSNPYYNVTNSVPLSTGYYTSTTARAAVPEGVRKTGLILTYETAAGVWYTERYIGTATDTTSWTTSSNWEVGVLRIASVTDTTEYAEITI